MVGPPGHHGVIGSDDPGIGRSAFGHIALAVDLPSLEGAGFLGELLAEHVGHGGQWT